MQSAAVTAFLVRCAIGSAITLLRATGGPSAYCLLLTACVPLVGGIRLERMTFCL